MWQKTEIIIKLEALIKYNSIISNKDESFPWPKVHTLGKYPSTVLTIISVVVTIHYTIHKTISILNQFLCLYITTDFHLESRTYNGVTI
jgi:hypothetical protein